MASGTESATETSYWLKFFTDAKIPAGDAAHYAVLFSDNRIQRGMLLDLSKEYLTDMGVTRLGDVIAILKHAKTVHDQDAKDKALKGARLSTSSGSSPLRRSTAASRMVDHFLSKTPDATPMNKPPPPKPSPNITSLKKSSVFDRLGADSSGSGSSPKTSSGGAGESVFSRLGGKSGQKRAASPTSPGNSDDDDHDTPRSPLGYHGILKFPTSTKKSPTVPHKKIRVTVEDEPVKVTGVEKVKVTGVSKVKVTGLDRVMVGSPGDSFDSSDVQPLRVQVSSTTMSMTPRAKIKRKMASLPDSSSLDDFLFSARIAAIQKAEVSTTTPVTRTAGVLSMDAPSQSASVKTRLGAKVHTAPASSTTSGFGPSTKSAAAGDVRSRLGSKSSSAAVSALVTVTPPPSLRARLGIKPASPPASSMLGMTTASQPQAKPTSGVFSRLGKKTPVS